MEHRISSGELLLTKVVFAVKVETPAYSILFKVWSSATVEDEHRLRSFDRDVY